MLSENIASSDTTFAFHPVDKGDAFIAYSSYGRLQSKRDGANPLPLQLQPHRSQNNLPEGKWLHAGDTIQGKEEQTTVQRVTDLEVFLTDKYHYEDVLAFKSVDPIQVEEINYVCSLHTIISEFVKKV